MAAGRGRQGGGFPAARLRLRLLLLPGALLSLLPLAAPDPSVTHRYENVKEVEISVQPTAAAEIISEETDSAEAQQSSNTGEIAAKKEEQTLNDLVNLLQDVVKNIPTEIVLSTEQPPTILVSNIVSSPSVAMDTVWVNVNPKSSGQSKTVALIKKVTPTTTAFWKLRSDATASVILHSNASPSESLQSETSESVVLISEDATATPGNTLGTISVQVEEATTREESKSFDELTNGALASLVESLKNVKKLHMTLTNDKPHRKSHSVKLPHHKAKGIDILEAIDTLIETIKNAPSSVKEDPALHEYVEEAEGYLKNALELAGEAERKLLQKKEQQMKLDFALLHPPSTAPPITEMKLDLELPAFLSEVAGTEVKLDVEITPSPSATPPITEVELEILPSASATPPVTEVELEILPSASTAAPVTEVELEIFPSASTAAPVTEVDILLTPSESLEEKAEDTQTEMGKLKAFINLLYGFSPQLTEYAENSPNKKVAKDIVERSMEVLDAIKSVFCGNPERRNKQILKQLLQKDMELVRQAMKEKRAS